MPGGIPPIPIPMLGGGAPPPFVFMEIKHAGGALMLNVQHIESVSPHKTEEIEGTQILTKSGRVYFLKVEYEKLRPAFMGRK